MRSLNFLRLLLPRCFALDDGGLEQDHELALVELLVAAAENAAQYRRIAGAGQTRAVIVLLLLHQAADRGDRAVLHAHDGIAFVDVARGERQA